jgi:hypothetical protein
VPLDDRDEFRVVGEQFPQLLVALNAAERLLKVIRSKRNQGLANDLDVEHARQARDLVRNILDAANWRKD